MRYTTSFEGRIEIDPPCSLHLTDRVNRFCDERHGGNMDHPGYPGFWCDYVVGPGGTWIKWNGNEKSYEMEEWLPVLIEKFFRPAGHVLNGVLLAQGERSEDRWRIVVKDNVVTRLEGHGTDNLDVDDSELPDLGELARFLYSSQGRGYAAEASLETCGRIAKTLLESYTVIRKRR